MLQREIESIGLTHGVVLTEEQEMGCVFGEGVIAKQKRQVEKREKKGSQGALRTHLKWKKEKHKSWVHICPFLKQKTQQTSKQERGWQIQAQFMYFSVA